MKTKNRKLSIIKQSIPSIILCSHNAAHDERGYLERIFCSRELKKIMSNKKIVQVNRTFTKKKGTIRGMHYQKKPFQETKIIQCIKGKILDIAVDLRKSSKTFLKHTSIYLDSKKPNSLIIPEGFAHGFQTLTNNVELLYFHTNFYNPKYESGLNPLDKLLSIDWPLNCKYLSERDCNFSLIDDKSIHKGFKI